MYGTLVALYVCICSYTIGVIADACVITSVFELDESSAYVRIYIDALQMHLSLFTFKTDTRTPHLAKELGCSTT